MGGRARVSVAIFQTLMLLVVLPISRYRPPALKAMAGAVGRVMVNLPSRWPFGTPHTRVAPSRLAAARWRPSGEKTTDATGADGPVRTARSVPVATSPSRGGAAGPPP